MLGSFRVLRAGELVALGGPKQRTLLAMLVLDAPRTVTVDRLADALWGAAAPARVETSLQSYVSNLRRALDTDAPLLTTRPGGWALDVDADRVDAARFERLVTSGQAARAAGRLAEAVAQLGEALAMWEPPLPEYAGEPWVREVVVRLEARHAVALEEWLAARLDLGEHVAALPDIEAAVTAEPLSEQLRAHLALAHYRAGNQTEALRSLARAREVLAEEVGVEPGPELRRLEAQILAHSADLDWRRPANEQPDMRALSLDPLIGRAAERATLASLVADARNGRFRCAVIDGDPGAGKSRLLEELELLSTEAGATVVWGRCYEGTGAPALWPWLQVVEEMVHEGTLDPAVATELDAILHPAAQPAAPSPDNGRFRLFESITAAIVEHATRRPLVIVIDDLQWADQGSLELLAHAAARLAATPVVLATAVRRAEAAAEPALGAALGALARTSGAQRLPLAGLQPADTARLVEQVTGIVPTAATAQSIAARTEGNPFFVRELARLLLNEGQSLSSTPLGVRDVVRRRLDGLDDRSRGVLVAAAVVGREADLTILATVTGMSLLDCLEAIEPAITTGVLDADSLASARFSHDIVREAILASASAVRRARLHLAVAEALERGEEIGADRVEQIAHHMAAAGPLVSADQLARALEAGADAAERRYGYESAVRLQRQAFELRHRGTDRAAELSAGVRLAALVGGVTGYAELQTSLMDRIDELAAELGRSDLTIFLRWSRWAAVDQAGDMEASRELASDLRALAEASSDPLVRQYGMQAWAIYCWHVGRIPEARAAFSAALPDIELVLDNLVQDDANAMVITSIVIGLGFAAGVTEITGDRQRAHELYDYTERRTAAYGPLAHVTRAMFGSVSAAYAGDARRALELTDRAIELDADGTMAFMSFFNRIMNAWARSQLGDADESIVAFDAALATFLASNARTGYPMWKAFHAEALLAAGRVDDAAAAVAAGITLAKEHGELQGLPLCLLVRAEVAAAAGASLERTAAALAEAGRAAQEQGALLLVERIQRMTADLGLPVA